MAATPSQRTELVVSDGIVLIRNPNTTIGYCRFDATGDIEYVFVHPSYRRQGHGTRLLEAVRGVTGGPGRPLEPISPLGRAFFGSRATGPDASAHLTDPRP
jgi:GNAT superfamily N-acetyltransferase